MQCNTQQQSKSHEKSVNGYNNSLWNIPNISIDITESKIYMNP